MPQRPKPMFTSYIYGTEVKEGFLNRVEMAFRAYDPCLSCATHTMVEQLSLQVNIRNRSGKIIHTANMGD